MTNPITPEQFLIVIKRALDYIGPDKFNELIKNENVIDLRKKEKTPDDILEQINQYRD
jgi:hypothetical protein